MAPQNTLRRLCPIITVRRNSKQKRNRNPKKIRGRNVKTGAPKNAVSSIIVRSYRLTTHPVLDKGRSVGAEKMHTVQTWSPLLFITVLVAGTSGKS